MKGSTLSSAVDASLEGIQESLAHVAILGLGPSLNAYTHVVKCAGSRQKLFDEVWAINALGGLFKCDLIFHMDDVRINQARADADPDGHVAAMMSWLYDQPAVMTSIAPPDRPNFIEFPLADVINNLHFSYFNSTAAYAVAFAIHIGVKKISLFGIDYTHKNAHHAEKGRACVEFYLGMAAARGIQVAIAGGSTLMDTNVDQSERYYGYDMVNVSTIGHVPDLRLEFTARDRPPTAQEIEERYDHSNHPAGSMADR